MMTFGTTIQRYLHFISTLYNVMRHVNPISFHENMNSALTCDVIMTTNVGLIFDLK